MNISNPNHNRKALVIFSGGQDSTTCLIQTIAEYGVQNVETVTFQYGQRHAIELESPLDRQRSRRKTNID